MKKYLQNLIFIAVMMVQCYIFLFAAKKLQTSNKMILLNHLTFVIFFFKERLYRVNGSLIWNDLKRLLKLIVMYSIFIILYFVVRLIDITIINIVISILILSVSVFDVIILKIIFAQIFSKKICIIGVGNTAAEISRIVNEYTTIGYRIQSYLDLDLDKSIEVEEKNKIIKLKIEDLSLYLNENKIEEVIVALPDLEISKLEKIVDNSQKIVSKIKVIPNACEFNSFSASVEDLDGMILVSIDNRIKNKAQLFLKRILDIIGALVGIVLLGILYLKYGREIKKDGGKVLFKHSRVGQGLKEFKMYKFRSMYIDAEERLEKILSENEELKKEFYTNFKLKNDPRITEIGNFLRKTSLDEFPQFINVLKGEMSLVGPRPVIKKEIDLYYGKNNAQKIFQVKPGITGMWQANGRSDIENYDERVALDLYYIRNWSLWLDIIILIKTVKNVFKGKGAY